MYCTVCLINVMLSVNSFFFFFSFKLRALRNAVQRSADSAGASGPTAQQSIPEYKIEIR